MEVFLIILATAVACAGCFILGAIVGQKVDKGEDIKVIPSPLKAHQEREAQKEAQREQEKVNTILQNIDSYDGTGANQKEVPRG